MTGIRTLNLLRYPNAFSLETAIERDRLYLARFAAQNQRPLAESLDVSITMQTTYMVLECSAGKLTDEFCLLVSRCGK